MRPPFEERSCISCGKGLCYWTSTFLKQIEFIEKHLYFFLWAPSPLRECNLEMKLQTVQTLVWLWLGFKRSSNIYFGSIILSPARLTSASSRQRQSALPHRFYNACMFIEIGVCREVLSGLIYLHCRGWQWQTIPAGVCGYSEYAVYFTCHVCLCSPLRMSACHQEWSCRHGCPLRWTVTRSRSGTRRRTRARGRNVAPAQKRTRNSRRRKKTRSTGKPLKTTFTMKFSRSSKSKGWFLFF